MYNYPNISLIPEERTRQGILGEFAVQDSIVCEKNRRGTVKRGRINDCLRPLKGHLEFSGAFFLAEIFDKVSFDPYNFRITRLSARKSEQMKNF